MMLLNTERPNPGKLPVLLASWVAYFLVFATISAWPAHAHDDDHDRLPSTGVTVNGNRLLVSPEAEKAIGLTTAMAGLKDLERVVTAHAPIEVPWRQHAFAGTLVKGRVDQVLVQPGERVSAGQELLRVEGLELESLQAELLQFHAQLALASRVARERENLAKTGSISVRSLQESQATERELMAQATIVTRKLQSLGLSQQTLDEVLKSGRPVRTVSIVSPLSGAVAHADVRIGQVVEPQQQLVEIVDLSKVWAHGQVLETDMASVAEGMPVVLSVDALSGTTPVGDERAGKSFASRIEHLGVMVDPESRSIHVHVPLDNKAGLLRPGMFGRLRITVASAKEAVVCPEEAVVHEGGRGYVLLQERDGVFVRQPVTLGMRSENWVEVLDGLFPGDPVVTTGKHELSSLFAGGAAATLTKIESTKSGLPKKVTTINVPATIELPTDRKSFAYSNVEGRIAAILVEHGQPVHAGQMLAEIESLDLRNLQLDLMLVCTKLDLAEQSLARVVKLDEQGSIAQKELWRLRTEVETLKNSVASLGHKLSQVGLSPAEIERIKNIDITSAGSSEQIATTFKVRAAADGRINAFDLALGQIVRPQDPLFEIHDLSKVWGRGFVFDRDATEVHVGQKVRVSVIADASFSAAGVISRVAPELSSGTRALTVWAELDNPNSRLKQGMLARMAIETEDSAVNDDKH